MTKLFLLFISWVLLVGAQPLAASSLSEDYQQVSSQSQTSVLPFIVLTSEKDYRLSTQIYSIVEQPYAEVSKAFTTPSNWCEFLPLHLNVKSCVFQPNDGLEQLTLYLGRKFYQPPEDTHQITYLYTVNKKDDSGFKVSLSAEEGPLGTEDYQLVIDAEPSENNTLVRVSMAYTSSMVSRLATETYLLTFGRGKIGFSINGTDSHDHPIFNGGIKAIIERNAMRYYLAMKVYVETQSLPVSKQFETRINNWFELTEQYREQLHELEKQEYLEAKRQEWQNQQQLQLALDAEIR